MLGKLQQVMEEGTLRITHLYIGHLKKDEDQKLLTHAAAYEWRDVEPAVKVLFEQHLYQSVQGALGQVNFPCHYTGQVLSVERVATPEYDRTRNRPAVEVFEAVRELEDVTEGALIELGNVLAYKALAAGTISNHLLGLLRIEMVPEMGAAPVTLVFASICDLEDKEEAFLDNNRGEFITQTLTNVVKRSSVSRAAFFPCLDEDGREQADLLVYASSGAAAWFKALEMTQKFSPRREGQTLVRLITQQTGDGEVPHDLFQKMGEELVTHAASGLPSNAVATSLEKAVGHGIDREGFVARWEDAFRDAAYKPSYEALFGVGLEKPTTLKMTAGEIQVTLQPVHLEHFRQVTVGKESFIVFKVPERAHVAVGKDLNLTVKPIAVEDLVRWLRSEG